MSMTNTTNYLYSNSTSPPILPPLAQSLVLSRLSTSPTLLPENLAKLVTALSLAARVSLRTSALFLEAILEGLQGSTVGGLGVTRRCLISAVASARSLHYLKGGLDWSGRDQDGKKTDDAFLTVLDKYTNLGIYLIHHTFTLAELFTMSSFYLTLNTVQTISTAAEESVRMLDSILGSNESSRALSSIISLVRKELTLQHNYNDEDDEGDFREGKNKRGMVTSLTALTKAITAFACLQTATHRRTLKELKMRVVYDCTIVVDHDAQTFTSSSSRSVDKKEGEEEEDLVNKRRKRTFSSQRDFDLTDDDQEGGGVLTDVRKEYERLSSSRRNTPRLGRSRTTSLFEGDEIHHHHQSGQLDLKEGIQIGDLQDGLNNLEFEKNLPREEEIVQELNQLVGLPEITTSIQSTSLINHPEEEDREEGYAGEEIDESELPEEVRIALREIDRASHQEEGGERNEKRIIRPRTQERGYSYEIEVEETTTTTTTTVRTVEEIEGEDEGGHRGNDSRIVSRRIKDRSRGRQKKRSLVELDNYEEGEEEEEEWVAVGEGSRKEEMETDDEGNETLPSASNGRSTLALRSRKEALEYPAENRQRLQVVLSTMTKKFTQRKRTVRRVSDSREPSPSLPSPAASSPSSSPTIGWSRSGKDPVEALRSQVSTTKPSNGSNKSNSVFRAFSKPFNRSQPPPPLVTPPEPEQTIVSPRPNPSPASTPFRNHERSISASTLAPPSAAQPPEDLPPQPLPLPLSPTSTESTTTPSLLRRTSSTATLTSSSAALTMTCKHRTSESTSREEVEPKQSNFPRRHLVSNLQHFARYSSAAYGQSFLRILGLAKSEFKFPHTEIHANNHSFAHHVGIHVEDILLSSFTDPQPNLSNEKISPIVNYVAVDHSVQAIVLSCRGSLGLSDILVDLTCDYEPMPVPEGDPHGSYLVHSGMFLSATTLQRGTVHDVIKEALERFPDYGLVICGHSLGGGVAALLSILWSTPSAAFKRQEAEIVSEQRQPPSHPPLLSPFVTAFSSGLPPGRPISCYTYGVPCVASPDLSKYSQGLIISTVHNYDIVPTLSIGVLRDLKTMAMGFYAETGVAEEIIGRVVGLCQRRFIARRATKKPTTTNTLPASLKDHEEYGMTPEALTDPSEESRLVPLTDRELEKGKSSNKALEPSYTDPSLLGPDMADDAELSDWLWSLRKTIRASSDNEKLYPPGTVYVVENYTVFISSESGEGNYSRREGRRVLLRAVDDVERRFSEPVFSRSMLSDHSPKSYETNCDLLAAAVL
ncbi:hypothetical protein JCM5350_007258 [Sporobolomyces pararoseus]